VDTLDDDTRRLLLRFACAMAWADFELHPKERTAILGLVERLEVGEDARAEVAQWLRCPPPPADGVVREEEREALELLQQILRGPGGG
jgi:tellurite resistance protein